jgi:hypothetical protein
MLVPLLPPLQEQIQVLLGLGNNEKGKFVETTHRTLQLIYSYKFGHGHLRLCDIFCDRIRDFVFNHHEIACMKITIIDEMFKLEIETVFNR